MSFTTSKEMLRKAQEGGYAIGAFNVENMEMIKAVLSAAEELRAPVILQTTPATVKYGALSTFKAMAEAEANQVSIPAALHLDHGNTFDIAIQAMEQGYTSIMIDGSQYSFEDNIDITKQVVAAAILKGIPVEAELGKVGGKEDDLEIKTDTNTDSAEAKEFADRTGIDSLAVAIGTAHGFYEGTPVLDKERLSEIRKVVEIPLVLHGASGLADEDIRDCIRRGICKVNFATELRVAYTDAIKELLKNEPKTFDPKKLGQMGMASVKELVMSRIRVCGCDGKAG